MFFEQKKDGIIYTKSSIIPFPHGFMTRYGGVSEGDFSSLNLGSNRGDDPEHVKENYKRLCSLFGYGENDCCVTKQVHGSKILCVGRENRHASMSEVPYEADGIVTAEHALPLMCFTADCVPALATDTAGNAVAAVHCGWRSSVSDILKNMVEEMERLGAERKNICIAFGPAIGKCCFETDRDVPDAIARYLGGDIDGLWENRENGKFLVDLRAANARRMMQLGIPKENIDISTECTMCLHERYWSNRYTLKNRMQRGNLASVIVLE